MNNIFQVQKLPAPVTDSVSTPRSGSDPVQDLSEDMRIAWRYNNLPKVDSVEESKKGDLGHYFDLSKTLDEETIRKVEISSWKEEETPDKGDAFIRNRHMRDCIKKLHETSQKYTSDKSTRLLRIVLNSFASPYWYTSTFVPDISKFLLTLKSIVRHTSSTCILTIPTHVLKAVDADLVTKIRSSVDYAIELESFAGSDRETNPVFKDYHGLLHIRKIQAVNSPAPYHPKIQDLAFKLRRKKFVIEKLHLPPELQDSDQREQDEIVPGSSCSSKGKKLLDF